MRFSSPFYDRREMQESRKYTVAKTEKEPHWPQSQHKPSARQAQPSADRDICSAAENRGLNRIGVKGYNRNSARWYMTLEKNNFCLT